MKRRTPSDQSRELGLSPLETFSPDQTGVYSSEKILERLAAAREAASQGSSRFTIIGVALVALYLVKVVGLRPDVVLLSQRVFDLPYGAFLFCILAQGALCVSIFKALEEKLYDRQIKAVCTLTWPNQGESSYRSFPKLGSIFHPAIQLVESREMGSVTGPVYTITFLGTFGLASLVLICPIAAGAFYLMDWEKQITDGNIDLQYYIVLATTVLSLLWTINYFVIDSIANKAPMAGR